MTEVPKTLAHRLDNVPYFDELVAELGDPFAPIAFEVTVVEHDDINYTSPTATPFFHLDSHSFVDFDEYGLDDVSNQPMIDADVTLPPLTVAALRLVASVNRKDQL